MVDTSEHDALLNYLLTLLNIKASSEEEEKDLQVQMMVIIDFIKTKFGFLTIPEIREAFKMYVAKDFGHKEIYRVLDTIIVSDVLNKFVNYRGERLRGYEPKQNTLLLNQSNELSEEEKDKIVSDGILKVFEEYKQTKQLPIPNFWIFDHLYAKNILPKNDTEEAKEYYSKIKEKAEIDLKNEYENKKSIGKKEASDIRSRLEKIVNGTSPEISSRSKKIAVEYFFNDLILNNKELKI